MKNDQNTHDKLKLRKKAEEALQSEPEDISDMSEEEMRHVIHELRVHQIELEMQNDELRQTQLKLEAARNQFSDLYDFAPVGYVTISQASEKGLILEANLTLCAMLGVQRKTLMRSRFSKFIHGNDGEIYYDHISKLMKFPNKQTFEMRLVKQDESQFHAQLECVSLLDEDGNITQIRAAITDISERKRAEEALKENEKRLKAIFESNPNPMVAYNTDGHPQYINPAFTLLFGWTLDELKGRPIPFVPDDLKEATKAKLDELYSSAKIVQIETQRLTKHGDVIDVIASGAYIKGIDGQPAGMVSNFTDISARKKLESQLRQSRKMESIGTLTGGVAHDFNNILGIIIGYAELALDDIPEWNPTRSNLEEIKTAGLRGASIIRQLLCFSRKTDQKLKPVEIISVIKDSLNFLRSTIPTTIEIHKNIPVNNLIILADPVQINQIIMNLCINASQEMEQTGGILAITVEEVILDKENINGYTDLMPGKYVKVSVSDTGKGIEPEIIDKIFDPYFTTKEVGQGSGMGLAVVHGIVKSHSGAITIESEPGKGAVFTMLFPAVKVVPEIEIEITDKLPFGNESILFVDDEKSITDMAKKILEHLGYRVEAKLNPVEALELFQSKPAYFDLVITDMTMPQMTGAKLFDKLKQIRPDIPVIVCTGHSSQIDEEKTKKMGIDALVMKPFSKQVIANTIRKVLDGK